MKMTLVVFVMWKCHLKDFKNIKRRYHETNSDFTRDQMRLYMTELTCRSCQGYRLNPQALAVKINGTHIGEVSELAIKMRSNFLKVCLYLNKKQRLLSKF